jgi:RDD family
MTDPRAGYEGGHTYGAPYRSVPPQPYEHPYGHGQQQPYGEPASAHAAFPQHTNGAALQPYSAAAAEPYAQPYAVGQIAGHRLVSAGGRLGAVLLDGLLMVITLWIGWVIWAMITWSSGQTPAKKLLGHVVADANTGQPFDWGRMALREFCIKGILGWILGMITLSVYFWVDSFTVFGDRQRTLHDRMANSVVRHV